MFLNALKLRVEKVPLLCTVYYFPPDVRWASFKKLLALWILSVLPLLFAGLRKPLRDEDSTFQIYVGAVLSEFESKSLFIFSISFLVPMLYLVWERSKYYALYAFSRKKAPEYFELPHGFGLVLFISIVVFLLTAFIYGSEPYSAGTILGRALNFGLVYIVYAFSLYCWYLTMLMSKFEKEGPDYVSETRQQEQLLTKGLSGRLSKEDDEEGEGNE